MKRATKGVVTGAVMLITMTGTASGQTPVLLQFVERDSAFAVQRSADGAAARLARPACQDVLGDFTDVAGERLSIVLAKKGVTALEAFGRIRLVDHSAAPQCHAGPTLAFTQTGSSVIRICSLQFRNRFNRNRWTTEIILIHEFLHALGLGENPPTSESITKRVATRCGG